MHRVQVPQRSGGAASTAKSTDKSTSPNRNHEPCPSLIRQVFFPIHPNPAKRAYDRSSSGAVSTQMRASNGSGDSARSLSTRRSNIPRKTS